MEKKQFIHKISYVKISQILPYEFNAKKHPAEQIKKLSEMILEFGFTQPVLIDSNFNLIAGHGRLESAKLLNMEEVPAIILDYLTDTQRRALIIADNKIGETDWNEQLLIKELTDILEEGFDLELTGFYQKELDELLCAFDDDLVGGGESEEKEESLKLTIEFDTKLDKDRFLSILDNLSKKDSFKGKFYDLLSLLWRNVNSDAEKE